MKNNKQKRKRKNKLKGYRLEWRAVYLKKMFDKLLLNHDLYEKILNLGKKKT